MSDDGTTAPDEQPAPEPRPDGGHGGRGWGLVTAAQAIGWFTLVAAGALWVRLLSAGLRMSMPRRYADYAAPHPSGAYFSSLHLYSSPDLGLPAVVVVIAPAAAVALVLARRARRLGPQSGTRSAVVTAVLALVLCFGLLVVSAAASPVTGWVTHG